MHLCPLSVGGHFKPLHVVVINQWQAAVFIVSFASMSSKAAMQLQVILCLLVILSPFLNVQCEELVSNAYPWPQDQEFIYARNGLAKVNFFHLKETYVGCMKHCRIMGGRSPPVKTKKDLDDMKGMLADLRAFSASNYSNLYLSVTCGEGNDDRLQHQSLEHWPKDILEAKDALWRDYYTGEELEN